MSCSQGQFVEVARSLQDEARRLGLLVPAFRSPCHSGRRALRRTRAGQVIVLVSFIGRDLHEVTEDMIEGTVAVQSDLGQIEAQVRAALWQAAGTAVAA